MPRQICLSRGSEEPKDFHPAWHVECNWKALTEAHNENEQRLGNDFGDDGAEGGGLLTLGQELSMHGPTFIEDEIAAPPECDREQFATRNESGLDTDFVSSPLDVRGQASTSEKSIVSPLFPLLGVMMVGFADWITSRALGAHLVVSLLMVIPIYFGVRVVGTRFAILVAVIGGSSCLVLDVFVSSVPQFRFFHFGLAATHLALYAAAVALAIGRRRLLAERASATTDILTGVANRHLV